MNSNVRQNQRTSLLEMNCMVISSSTLVVAVLIPGGSLAALPNFFHFFRSATMGKTFNF